MLGKVAGRRERTSAPPCATRGHPWVYLTAIERGTAGEPCHTTAEEGVGFQLIGEAIGRLLGQPARSIAPHAAEAHFGVIAVFAAGDGPASNLWTRDHLGWEPSEVGIIAEI